VIRPAASPLVLGAALAAALAGLVAWGAAEEARRGPDRDLRIAALREQIARLEAERGRIALRERGVLGDLERTRSELRLAERRLEEVGLRLEAVEEAIARRSDTIGGLEFDQEERARYLVFRLRQLYREGPTRAARIAVGGQDVEGYLASLRYASWLGARDARLLGEYRRDRDRLDVERSELVAERERLDKVLHETEAARSSLDAARRRQGRALARLREDRTVREAAMQELSAAAASLDALVEGGRLDAAAAARPDVAKLRGLLDPPVRGRIAAGFGDVVHPRFKTRVPHPGVDFVADEGTPFRAVFEGRVVYSAWLRGYGLTAIVDHGNDTVSVYAHASALLVEEGEEVLSGQKLGYVGETGSTQGPRLYFELRREGRPVDPAGWFRR
jgi:septal ring factor EnvC (AmiA/AmiB activator)